MAVLAFSSIFLYWINRTTVIVSISTAVPPFTCKLFNYMYYIHLYDIAYCFLVCSVMWVGLHPSKYSLEWLDDTRYSGLRWVLHNWRLSGGVKQRTFCGEEPFTLDAAFKMFIAFYQILRLINFSARFFADQINFRPHNVRTSYFFKLHFNIITRLSTNNPPVLHSFTCTRAKLYFSAVQGYTFQFIFSITVSQK